MGIKGNGRGGGGGDLGGGSGDGKIAATGVVSLLRDMGQSEVLLQASLFVLFIFS